MEIFDKNQTLQPPEDYWVHSVSADGSYLRLEYRQGLCATGTTAVIGENTVVVFLNDAGREVLRTQREEVWLPSPEPVGRWFRFRDGCLIVLGGLQEMMIWRKSS